MNRFKKHCIKKLGICPDDAYPWTPYETMPGISLETTTMNAAECTITEVYNVIVLRSYVGRDGTITHQEAI